MLDEHLQPKVSDFGFSIHLPKTIEHTTLILATDLLAGANGYRPPEYMDGKYSTLSDVYAFGVVSPNFGIHAVKLSILK